MTRNTDRLLKNNPRPKSFEFFELNNKRDPNRRKNKEVFKKLWKYFRWMGIAFLVLMSIVGCIQPLFMPVSRKVGAGFELYSSKQKVSPYVAVVKYDSQEKQYMLSATSLERADNIYLGSEQETKGNPEINQELVADVTSKGADFYSQGIIRVAVHFLDEGDIVYNKIDRSNKRQFLAFLENQTTYVPIFAPTDIFLFEVSGSSVAGVGESLEAVDPKNGNTNNINFSETNKFNHLVVRKLSKDVVFKSSTQLFARDVLQALYEKTKTALEKEYGNTLHTVLNKLLTLQRVGPNEKAKEFSLTKLEQEVLMFYNKAIAHYLTSLRFMVNKNNQITMSEEVQLPPFYPGTPGAPIQSWFASSWKEVWGYGPFYALFVWPIFVTMEGISSLSTSWAGTGVLLAILIIVLITKLLQFMLTFKTIFSQYKMDIIKPQKARIEAKYANYPGNKLMQSKKQQELAALYKKHNIRPFGMFMPLILTTPVMISVWRVFMASPEIKSTSIGSIQFSETSYSAVLSGQWQYLIIILVALIVQLTSQLLPKFLQRKRTKLINVYERDAMRKQNRTQNIMSIFFVLLSIFFQAGVQFYWTITGIWTICQNLFVHYFQRTNFFKIKVKPRL